MGPCSFLRHAWYLGIKQLPPLHMFHPTSHGSQCHTSIVSYSPRAHQAFLPMWREALWAWWVAWTYWKARSHLGPERRIVKKLYPPVWLLGLAVYHVLWKADTAIQFICRSRSEPSQPSVCPRYSNFGKAPSSVALLHVDESVVERRFVTDDGFANET